MWRHHRRPARRGDEHLGEEKVVVAPVLVVARGVLGEVGPSAGKEVTFQVPASDRAVHEVHRPAHAAEAMIRAQLEGLPLLDNIRL